MAFIWSAQTEKGSALHEAALFGKTDVVQKLLSAGCTSSVLNPRNFHVFNKKQAP